jgi:hypothetical protein
LRALIGNRAYGATRAAPRVSMEYAYAVVTSGDFAAVRNRPTVRGSRALFAWDEATFPRNTAARSGSRNTTSRRRVGNAAPGSVDVDALQTRTIHSDHASMSRGAGAAARGNRTTRVVQPHRAAVAFAHAVAHDGVHGAPTTQARLPSQQRAGASARVVAS